MKLFSVLMSVYKNEKPRYLQEALDSVLRNTVVPDEIVIVKDGPLPDELNAVLNEYQNKTSLFRFVIHKKNMGLGLALRDGLLECRNELVARMDTDDVCVKERFAKQLTFMENHPDISVVGSNVDEFVENIQKPYSLIVFPEKDADIRSFAKKRNPMKHPAVMFRKSAVLKSGNYRHFLWFEDYDLCIRMLLAGYKMANISEVLLHYRADKNLYERRGGWEYLKQDMNFQRFMLGKGFINKKEFLMNCSIRSIIRLMPSQLRAKMYQLFLRKTQ